MGIDPDSVVLSHPDGGHLGGGAAVWEAFPIRQAVLPAELSRSPAFQSWRREGPKAGIRMLQVASNETLVLSDQAHLETLNIPDPLAVNTIADERVAVFRLHWRGWKILFTSDAGMGTELKLLDSGRDLSADVIVAGMHTGDLTLGDAFLDAVDPQVVIASNARFPIEERRNPQTMEYWKSRGIRVFDQAESGAVSIFVDESGNLRLEGFLDAAPVLLRPR